MAGFDPAIQAQMSKRKSIGGEEGTVADRAAALKLFPVPPEIEARLAIYAELLRKWQRTINLVAASTLPQMWTRHFADSLQVQAAAPMARIWADLGSGAGFPGLVTAIRLAETQGAQIHLIEADRRKCAFLREVSRETLAPALVHQGRIEEILPEIGAPIEAVSARALAPLPVLLDFAGDLLEKGAVGLFLKGQRLDDELTDSRRLSRDFETYDFASIRSATSGSGSLLIVRHKGVQPRTDLKS